MALPELMTVDVGGTPIAIRDTATLSDDGKPPLVLLHGLGGSSQTWAFQFRALADDYRVIAWDMPGYGASGGFVRENPTVEHYAHALSATLDAIGAFKAHIVGQSVAALIGAAYAAEYPDQTLSYTFCQGLTGLAGLPDDERAKQRKARLDTLRELGPERFAEERGRKVLGSGTMPMVAELAVTIMKRAPLQAMCQAIEMMAQTDFFEIAPRIDCPSLVIAGSEDPASPVDVGQSAREALGDGPMEIIDGAGHYGCMEQPAAFNEVMNIFITNFAKCKYLGT
ncbi:MAG: alpha/beta fold hydrolase [Alphaproteobacteria bacterium]